MILLHVLVPLPLYGRLPSLLTWLSPAELPAPATGSLVRVPLGHREVLGIVWSQEEKNSTAEATPQPPATDIEYKPIRAVFSDIAPLSPAWCALIDFSARYYQRNLGELALAALPPKLRECDAAQSAKLVLKSKASASASGAKSAQITGTANTTEEATASAPPTPPPLSPEQEAVLTHITKSLRAHPAQGTAPNPYLLFGSTGSGKTEVYLRLVEHILRSHENDNGNNTGAQILVMVPEINLTPQLETRFRDRFPKHQVVSLHSAMPPGQRLRSWLQAHHGQAQIVLGTRMAVFASLPHLRLIIVDEEHDPSYKSQDGARHSARDLAVWRAKNEAIPVLLGSATPSLESWHAAQTGRYTLLTMRQRIAQAGGPIAALPSVRMVDMRLEPKNTVFSAPLLDALRERIKRQEQSLLFLNRRGYAPVLHCADCEWKSACPHCSSYQVYHKNEKLLRCHHCGTGQRVPRACPNCGNLDLLAMGRGTERIEELLAEALSDTLGPDGDSPRIMRIDADTTKNKGELQSQLARVHSGEIDILIGTQMIAKGHDFRRITLVAALQPDASLFSSDFRAAERLFSLLMQAGGRAGRDAAYGQSSELIVQTSHPTHPLYHALRAHDYAQFAEQQLSERAAAAMPPFGYQALLRAESKNQTQALDFLRLLRQQAQTLAQTLAEERAPTGADKTEATAFDLHIYPPIPMPMQRIANIERCQMLIESRSRKTLHLFLHHWRAQHLHEQNHPGILRWGIDIDPLFI